MTDDPSHMLEEIMGPVRSGRQPARRAVAGAHRCTSLANAIETSGLQSGGVVTFHHHYRNGDGLLNAALDIMAAQGLRDLTLAASSLFPVHAPLVGHLRSGVVRQIITSYVRGPVADFIAEGGLSRPIVLQSHGGRARALCSRQLQVDLAIIGVSLARGDGASTGRLGRAACGPLGYAMVDAGHSSQVLVVADTIADFPAAMAEIPAHQVDYLVEVPSLGDPEGILSGVTIPLATPLAKQMGQQIAGIIREAGLLKPGFSFQTGSGGYSLGSVPFIGAALAEAGLKGDFISGGITAAHVEIVQRGLMSRIRDVQSFDLMAVKSAAVNTWHQPMSAEEYASPQHPDPAVSGLSTMIIGAAEIDRDFNVNVARGSDDRIIGGPGGHPDAAFGANLAIVATPLTGGGFAKVVETVSCCTTPGSSVDAVVTDAGIAFSQARADLALDCFRAGLPVVGIGDLISSTGASRPTLPRGEGRVLALVEDRAGRLLDVIRARSGVDQR